MKTSRRSLIAGDAYGSALGLHASALRARSQPSVLRFVAPWEITGLGPARAGYVFGRMQVAETLVGADDGGMAVPQLAKSRTLPQARRS